MHVYTKVYKLNLIFTNCLFSSSNFNNNLISVNSNCFTISWITIVGFVFGYDIPNLVMWVNCLIGTLNEKSKQKITL